MKIKSDMSELKSNDEFESKMRNFIPNAQSILMELDGRLEKKRHDLLGDVVSFFAFDPSATPEHVFEVFATFIKQFHANLPEKEKVSHRRTLSFDDTDIQISTTRRLRIDLDLVTSRAYESSDDLATPRGIVGTPKSGISTPVSRKGSANMDTVESVRLREKQEA
eukprot:TRINITY_DN2854_c0_g1_i2.p1 TRINITY_DN2854_c0_g1~~TRINITY_DN2854_c0_g1_i2.p1  ORF type:complete len:165 (-),score=37.86 TRINITY_DN2854_c0_g1_i2:315-809(-)